MLRQLLRCKAVLHCCGVFTACSNSGMGTLARPISQGRNSEERFCLYHSNWSVIGVCYPNLKKMLIRSKMSLMKVVSVQYLPSMNFYLCLGHLCKQAGKQRQPLRQPYPQTLCEEVIEIRSNNSSK